MATYTRQATLEDLDLLLANVQAGFDSYAAFAGLGWRPPEIAADRERAGDLLADPQTWAVLAFADGHPAGHVAFFPGRERFDEPGRGGWRARALIPGVAHLWQLFVLPTWWGRGVAPALHDAAISEMRRRGFVRARLFTPALHARARRFYERRSWSATGEEWNDDLALMLTEYGRPLV